MKARMLRFVACTLPLFVPAMAFAADEAAAAEGGNPMSWSWAPYVSSLIVFGAAFFILSRTAWPKIVGGLQEREEKIKRDIAEAEKSRKQAEKALSEYEQALADARSEAGKILEQARQDQQRLAAELKSKTEAELNSMRDSAKRDIEAAKKQAVGEIYDHMATVATSIAGRILEREISADDQRRLVEESLSQLQPAGAN
jgi:F-type H+-transporting ATPase subunit b